MMETDGVCVCVCVCVCEREREREIERERERELGKSVLAEQHDDDICMYCMADTYTWIWLVYPCNELSVRGTEVQSQVESYQRLKKWYLMPPWLKLSILRCGSRVKWSNPGNGVVPFPTPGCSSNWKGSLRVTVD